MRFTVSSKTLNENFFMLAKVLAPKNVLPILDDFVIKVENDTLHVIAADAENIMEMIVPTLTCEGQGTFGIHAKYIMEALKNMGDRNLIFEINEEKSSVKVTHDSGVFSLPADNVDNFPKPHEISPKVTVKITENLLQENIARSIFSTADDELRPVMNGILFEKTEESLNIVATNGHHLVRNKITSMCATKDEVGSFILPKRTANILKNILRKNDDTADIIADERWIKITTENTTIHSRLVEGRYPNYRVVIPKNNNKLLSAERTDFINTLKRVSPFSNGNSELVKMTIKPNCVTIEAEDFEYNKKAKETFNAEYDGKEMEIGFKNSSLLGLIDNIKTEQIQVMLDDPARPALIQPAEQPEGQEILMLIMPMML